MFTNDLLTGLTQFGFILLGLVTAFDYFRNRSTTRRDIALMFGALAVPFIVQVLDSITRIQNDWLSRISSVALITQPYLLLRLAGYYRNIPPILVRAAQIGMVVSWLVILVVPLLPTAFTTLALLAVIVYFAAINGYAMVVFIRGALTTAGVVRQRLRFAAAGSGLLAITLLLLAFAALVPSLSAFITPVIFACILASAFSYYIGFAPPRWLRRTWQFSELRNFLFRISTKPIGERLSLAEGLSDLCHGANLALGGNISAVVQKDENGNHWTVNYVTDHPEWINNTYNDEGMLKQVWQERKPICFYASSSLSPADQRLLAAFGADTVMITPIVTAQRSWGLLLVFPRHTPLFVQDDLDLVILLAQQSAIFLENSTLLEQLNIHTERLKETVEQRTQELEETRVEYRRIVEMAQEGIWESDQNFKTRFVNPRMAEMLGYSVEEIMAKPATDFLAPETLAKVASFQERRLRGVKEQAELKFRHKDGSTLTALSSSTPLFDENGQYAGSVAMLADITERKRAEDEILKLNAELEQRVADRTARLTAVNRELEAFSYSVSHDLRTPLRALDGFSQILLEDYSDKLDADGLKYLQRIRAGSQRMGQLIDALLQLARLTRVELQVAQVNLSEIAQSIRAELQEENSDRKVDFRIQENLIVSGDERLLRVVLTNLINNAWKFTGKQTAPCVEFGMTQQDGKPTYYVRDNGVGFDMAYAGKLFGAFQRLHNLNDFEGTGIGLATVQRILHRHNGEIWVEAAVNQGATFYFTL